MLLEVLEEFTPVLNGLCLLGLVFYSVLPVLSLTSGFSSVSKPNTSPTYQGRQEPETLA